MQSIVLFIIFVLAFGLAGSALGLAYRWVDGRRLQKPERKLEPGRWQDITVIVAGVLLFIAAISITNTLLEFVTIHTGTTTTSLDSETQGVHWYPPAPVTANIADPGVYPPGLDAGVDGTLAASWVIDQDGQREVVYAYQLSEATGSLAWSNAIRVSNSAEGAPDHPQLALDSSGRAHIVWSESSDGKRQILYSRCEGETCLTPEVISEGACSVRSVISPATAIGRRSQYLTRIDLLVAWNAGGQLGFRTWQAGEQPTAQPAGCILPASGADPALQPRLAAGGEETFTLVYSIRRIWQCGT